MHLHHDQQHAGGTCSAGFVSLKVQSKTNVFESGERWNNGRKDKQADSGK